MRPSTVFIEEARTLRLIPKTISRLRIELYKTQKPVQKKISELSKKPEPRKPVRHKQRRKKSPNSKGRIICKICKNQISNENEAVDIHGQHRFLFPNPAGIVFPIVCYRNAESLQFIGDPSHEFSWFRGYAWQIVICARCQSHLGWYYLAADRHYFYTFIETNIEIRK